MVNRYRSRKPLELPPPEHSFNRADLVFYGLEHSGPTYEGRIFLGAKRGLKPDAGVDHPAYAGSFYVFGHTGCFGEEGHCKVPDERDPFDLRLPHHLARGSQIVTVTDVVKRLLAEKKTEVEVTVFALDPGGEPVEALDFETLRLLTYA